MKKFFRVSPEQVLFWWGVLALLYSGSAMTEKLSVSDATAAGDAARIVFQADANAGLIMAVAFFLSVAIIHVAGRIVSAIKAKEING